MNELHFFLIFFLIWIFLGGVGIWCTLFTYRKLYYEKIKKDDFFKTDEFIFLIKSIGLFLPIFLIGGLLVILSVYMDYPNHFTFYFKIPKDK